MPSKSSSKTTRLRRKRSSVRTSTLSSRRGSGFRNQTSNLQSTLLKRKQPLDKRSSRRLQGGRFRPKRMPSHCIRSSKTSHGKKPPPHMVVQSNKLITIWQRKAWKTRCRGRWDRWMWSSTFTLPCLSVLSKSTKWVKTIQSPSWSEGSQSLQRSLLKVSDI